MVRYTGQRGVRGGGCAMCRVLKILQSVLWKVELRRLGSGGKKVVEGGGKTTK